MPATTDVQAFTDGACHGNPGPGGWAALLKSGNRVRRLGGAEAQTTNNRMELQAAIEALAAIKQPAGVTLVTDSQYVKNGITQWIHNWKRNGWKTAAGKPVKNGELWQALDEQCRRHDVHWEWTRGHAGHPENEACDELATQLAGQVGLGLDADQLRVDEVIDL